ncbi:hypothetical protein NPIL_141771 [Nephila pilipes]|uniref:Uncharacterized protein n=1 Tax=Nephila pilipes TaxID=299642 RepID=A0A8X6IET9_NEPPI|nr:hypothetical protein NPIL_141771 [Nephila pilipes]
MTLIVNLFRHELSLPYLRAPPSTVRHRRTPPLFLMSYDNSFIGECIDTGRGFKTNQGNDEQIRLSNIPPFLKLDRSIHGHDPRPLPDFRARDPVRNDDLQKQGRCAPESAKTGSQLPRDQEEKEHLDLESSLHVLERA